ncbi:5-methyltetrahydropteroyltriglutamate--homocysteine S-methyltransferase [Thermomicrobium sp. 4228-Ro]|uniref:5-methyltetrahydropteroyltriglutamate-- homocysteine S-methyltransferase n=1 Tax=Thermomicrobium sp. 4228-Ro TaxID=2993937 RepID=UPI0022492440|nr:5-methyltetrahydropteroyltriglutamate--homocysteine S-methyltransferase [Thermomicrobium sp. 4228-Ro]MCX2726576.1 5-methyltetrahydropteroyltriglutamate--homocysteine S-methyltransferase [Thermomicrobium sp. 4228-Ro]
MARSSVLGYPRIGKRRDLKRALERYWAGESDEAALLQTARSVRRAAWEVQREAGIDLIPCNDFSLYDHVLDTICLLGLVPERFGPPEPEVSLSTYFAMARGRPGAPALELTKWFDTNYHYLVPEFDGPAPRLASAKPFEEFVEATEFLGKPAKPVLLGPLSLLLLGKRHRRPLDEHLDALLSVYREVLERLAAAGAEWVQMDEPVLVQDRSEDELRLLRRAYDVLGSTAKRPQIMLQTFYGSLDEASWDLVMTLPVEGVGLDFVRDDGNRALLNRHGFPEDKVFGAGVVDGRNVWRTNLVEALEKLEEIAEHVPVDRIWVQPTCSLLHLPHDVRLETRLPASLRALLAFAEQRLEELVVLTRALNEGRSAILDELERNAEVFRVALDDLPVIRPAVRERVAALTEDDFRRTSPYRVRETVQRERFQLPLFPTTTIGSFPQTPDVRQARARWRAGTMSDEEYWAFIRERIADVIRRQEEIGLDVLVHGEFERTDMVEYFAAQLDGFVLTEHGWVQSYGSRVIRPPIIFGDVARPKPMTVEVIRFAQSLTDKPVKGMLTGPVTILNWSFVRQDIPRHEVAYQIALALRDEVRDLEAAGIGMIQIDEPALREGLPLRRAEWGAYLDWAVRAFRLASSGVRDETQIHTHMCYSEFNDIIEAIDALDADVISIENSRSHGELLQAFQTYRYERQIGPGVYDVHSTRIPSVEEVLELLERALAFLRPEQLWVNPDCGLKTRRPEEVWPSLQNMVEAARRLRARYHQH